ncbi:MULTISPECIES: G/U mismatch-specific DNA glycosylase [unclassified Leptolyngbya]|uniref:G/U mismatch-specific DNA glycosylase n=1 Tax=unclassified Leptolyngbya TaxID=2650499 RepID=UPI00168646A7|nr:MULTISPECIES: G/U mismatch-specific DNA glycosylase [unclassified Leptolyngbya]MBD1912082.1 G/U mismatch-specific DNA glycosylase [Leptolyngbya sp. FACHB-8]MBD2153802.1 G/U mismatch-specific DNA glycosylase [Leptolyngbya sp. FACHB-16]
MTAPPKPTKAEIQSCIGQTMHDVIAPDLKVLFCGINPSLYSAAVGHHFARPGNRFWPTLYAAGFTPRLYSPAEDGDLLKLGYGITNIADPATARADELTLEDLRTGQRQLTEKVLHYKPRVLAVLGVSAYRTAFSQPKTGMGLQAETIGETAIWILPNPSGLNAHYQLPELAVVYRELLEACKPN